MDAEQVARNDAIYRDANERIERAAVEYEVTGAVPFICECADPECRGVVLLTLREYEEIRASATRFFSLPGHEAAEVGHLRTVRSAPGYVVVEKTGLAGDIVEELDPRQAQHG